VFSGNSTTYAINDPMSPLGTTGNPGDPNDQFFTGGDSALSGSTTMSGTQLLLVDIPVTTVGTGTPPVPGDTFTITLLPASANTYFLDDNSMPLAFTSTPGTVTIVTPLPTPLLGLLVLLGMLGLVSRFYRRPISNLGE